MGGDSFDAFFSLYLESVCCCACGEKAPCFAPRSPHHHHHPSDGKQKGTLDWLSWEEETTQLPVGSPRLP